VTVPAFQSLWSQHDEINHHKRRYRVGQLETMFAGAGFEVGRIAYCNSLLFLPVLVTRKVKTFLRRFRDSDHGREPVSDLAHYPAPINDLLYRIVSLETRLLRPWSMPFGVSILAVAQRPLATADQHQIDIDSLIAEALPPKVLAAQ